MAVEKHEDKLEDIQKKLFYKVLPILERHLTDTADEEEQHHVRTFVAISIVRTIRKLPLH